MSEKITQIIDLVKELSVVELGELVSSFEEEFGVTAAAVAVAGAGAAAGGRLCRMHAAVRAQPHRLPVHRLVHRVEQPRRPRRPLGSRLRLSRPRRPLGAGSGLWPLRRCRGYAEPDQFHI